MGQKRIPNLILSSGFYPSSYIIMKEGIIPETNVEQWYLLRSAK